MPTNAQNAVESQIQGVRSDKCAEVCAITASRLIAKVCLERFTRQIPRQRSWRFLTGVLNSPQAYDLSGVRRAPIAFDCAWAVLTGENVVRILGRDVDRDHWAAAYCVEADGQGDKREESKSPRQETMPSLSYRPRHPFSCVRSVCVGRTYSVPRARTQGGDRLGKEMAAADPPTVPTPTI